MGEDFIEWLQQQTYIRRLIGGWCVAHFYNYYHEEELFDWFELLEWDE